MGSGNEDGAELGAEAEATMALLVFFFAMVLETVWLQKGFVVMGRKFTMHTHQSHHFTVRV